MSRKASTRKKPTRSRASLRRRARRSSSSNRRVTSARSRGERSKTWDRWERRAVGRVHAANRQTYKQTCKRDALKQVEHENLWGFWDLTLESPRLPPHIRTAARKHGLGPGRRRYPSGPLGE